MKFAVNKKIRFEYDIIDRFEAGLSLTGPEVKSVRQGKVNITDTYVRVKRGELYLVGLHISDYESRGYSEHDPLRDKKLLMHKHEITKLSSKMAEKGLSLIPISIYAKNRYIKVELGLVKGRKLHDKREELKRRAVEREIDRDFKIK